MMKKIITALSLLSFVAGNAQTVESIIKQYSDNIGGLAAFNAIKTMKTTGTFSTQGIDMPVTVQAINNKASRSDMEYSGMQVINVYNNGKGWKQNPLAGIPSPTLVTDSAELRDLKEMAQLATPLMDYKARGHQVVLQGQETVEGIRTWKILLTDKGGSKKTIYYLIASDYTLLKTATEHNIQGQKTIVETWYSYLKTFNGLKFFMERTYKIGTETFQTITLNTVELNVPIDEKIFNKPGN